MAIVRFADQKLFRNPWADFERMRRELDAIFQEPGGQAGATVFPALNISEDGARLYVRAEIPGVPAEEVDISIEGDTLTIRGERKTGLPDEKYSYHRRELERGRFSRAVTLPVKVQVDRIEAKAANGIVTIILPKAEAAVPRQIKVNVA